MMGKTEKATRWTMALGICSVLSFVYAVVFLAGVAGLTGLVIASVFWTISILCLCAMVVIRYRSVERDYQDRR